MIIRPRAKALTGRCQGTRETGGLRKCQNMLHPDRQYGCVESQATLLMKFELLEPQTLDEAVSLLSHNPDETRVIAGGQSLLLMIRSGLLMPRYLVSLNTLPELHQINRTGAEQICIGSTVIHCELLS